MKTVECRGKRGGKRGTAWEGANGGYGLTRSYDPARGWMTSLNATTTCTNCPKRYLDMQYTVSIL